MNQALVESMLKFLLRRGLTMLGTAGASVSDDWVAQTASLLLVAGNEVYQWRQSHKAERRKADGTYEEKRPLVERLREAVDSIRPRS